VQWHWQRNSSNPGRSAAAKGRAKRLAEGGQELEAVLRQYIHRVWIGMNCRPLFYCPTRHELDEIDANLLTFRGLNTSILTNVSASGSGGNGFVASMRLLRRNFRRPCSFLQMKGESNADDFGGHDA
jgi:hypothetical protein